MDGQPSAFDQMLATRFGVATVQFIQDEKFGKMVASQGNRITGIPLAAVVSRKKTVDREFYKIA
jgi:6-phosphofructokinase 1